MVRRNKGFSLLEVMIAGMLLLVAVGFFVVSYVSFESRLATYRYIYTALNLGRDCLEYVESVRYTHPMSVITYKYNRGRNGYLPLTGPFASMGDIKAKGMVPRDHPDSVVIKFDWGFNAQNFPITGKLTKPTVEVKWKENLPGRTQAVERKVMLSGVPITWYNDQIDFNIGKFWWEER